MQLEDISALIRITNMMLPAVLFSTSETGKNRESTRVYKYASRTCGLRYRPLVRWVPAGQGCLCWWELGIGLMTWASGSPWSSREWFLDQDVKKFEAIDVDSYGSHGISWLTVRREIIGCLLSLEILGSAIFRGYKLKCLGVVWDLVIYILLFEFMLFF